MSKAELLLNKLDASRVATRLVNASEEPHLIIGDDRIINVPDELKRLAVQYDHDIETVTFDCPRYWDEHDMSKMGVYINYLCADKTAGIYQANNVRVDEADSTVMHFDWTISRNVSFVAGPIAFLVCVRNADAEGFEKNHWNSEICTSCYISKGLEYDGEVIDNIMSPDLIEQWRKKVNEITDDLATRRDNGEFNGATFTPQVDARGYISWSNDKNLDNPPAVNIRGPKGISPKITVTDIQGGHRIQIDAENYSGHFDVMDTYINNSDAVTELLNRFITVSSVKPTVGPGIWFDPSNHKAANHAEMQVINADGTSTPIYPDSVEVGYSASSEDGLKYTVTVPGLIRLENGTSFIIIPEVDNNLGRVMLSVNDLGELPLVSRRGWNSDITTWSKSFIDGDIKAGIPIRVTLSTKIGSCWIAEIQMVGNKDFDDILEINNGGTGATNIEQAAQNLKFNSLAYATDLSAIDDINAEIPIGKYYISANTYQGSGEFPFLNYWSYCILTVEDSNGKGGKASNEAGNSGNDSYYFQTIVSNQGEKFSREIVFNDGAYAAGSNWIQYHVSASPIRLNIDSYGKELPTIPTGTAASMHNGQIFFKKNDGCYIYEGGASGWVKYF